MDLLIVFIVLTVIGLIKVNKNGVSSEESVATMSDDGTITVIGGDYPIGNNLMLKYEPDAFTLIIRELGLRK